MYKNRFANNAFFTVNWMISGCRSFDYYKIAFDSHTKRLYIHKQIHGILWPESLIQNRIPFGEIANKKGASQPAR